MHRESSSLEPLANQAYHSARCKVEGTLNGLLQLLYLSVMLSLMCVIDIPVMGLEKMGNGKNEMAHLAPCLCGVCKSISSLMQRFLSA